MTTVLARLWPGLAALALLAGCAGGATGPATCCNLPYGVGCGDGGRETYARICCLNLRSDGTCRDGQGGGRDTGA